MEDAPVNMGAINDHVAIIAENTLKALANSMVQAQTAQPCHRSRAILHQEVRQRILNALDTVLRPE
ncbi:hypothetical protein EVB27_038 [Rhizobium phage RHph_TM16]|nr:hypothetical protein EVB27_038 [Rhizobium phage RHph_TM16]